MTSLIKRLGIGALVLATVGVSSAYGTQSEIHYDGKKGRTKGVYECSVKKDVENCYKTGGDKFAVNRIQKEKGDYFFFPKSGKRQLLYVAVGGEKTDLPKVSEIPKKEAPKSKAKLEQAPEAQKAPKEHPSKYGLYVDAVNSSEEARLAAAPEFERFFETHSEKIIPPRPMSDLIADEYASGLTEGVERMLNVKPSEKNWAVNFDLSYLSGGIQEAGISATRKFGSFEVGLVYNHILGGNSKVGGRSSTHDEHSQYAGAGVTAVTTADETKSWETERMHDNYGLLGILNDGKSSYFGSLTFAKEKIEEKKESSSSTDLIRNGAVINHLETSASGKSNDSKDVTYLRFGYARKVLDRFKIGLFAQKTFGGKSDENVDVGVNASASLKF